MHYIALIRLVHVITKYQVLILCEHNLLESSFEHNNYITKALQINIYHEQLSIIGNIVSHHQR